MVVVVVYKGENAAAKDESQIDGFLADDKNEEPRTFVYWAFLTLP